MSRPIALVVSIVALLAGAVACGGTKDFVFDAGATLSPVDAGPCDVYAQSGCPAGQKCTIHPDGTPVCGAQGSSAAYATCTGDDQCPAGTACVTLGFTGYLSGQRCYAFCEPGPSSSTHGTCTGGATCLGLPNIPEGFCDVPADGG